MKKILDFFFSMQLSMTLLLMFAVAIGTATFIENDYGTEAAKAMVYNATWFEILLGVLTLSMTGIIFRYKLIRKKKYNVLIFHLAFAVIMIGAGITRFIGYEGTMHIREGETSNEIISLDTYLRATVSGNNQSDKHAFKAYFTPYKKNKFSESITVKDSEVHIMFREYIQNVAQTIANDPDGDPIISLMILEQETRDSRFLLFGESIEKNSISFCFGCSPDSESDVMFTVDENNEVQFISTIDIVAMSMGSGTNDTLKAGFSHPLETRKLYSWDRGSFVVRSYNPSGKLKYVSAPDANHDMQDGILMDIAYKGDSREIILIGGKGYYGEPEEVVFDDISVTLSYGSKPIITPFSIKLRDFQLERYPGSRSPSSFASEVTLIDDRYGINEERRIFMNNVLNYGGYRFFQSSYDPDELGTILSVNKDRAGTLVTYAGYFLMTLGMVLNLFMRRSRFRWLLQQSARLRKYHLLILALIGLFFFLNSNTISAQSNQPAATVVDKEHADEFGKLLVLDRNGRIKPVNTLSSEVLRKISRKSTFMGQSSDQVLLGMISNPAWWQSVPMIKVSDQSLKDLIGITGNYASFNDFVNLQTGNYKLSGYIDAAYNKKPGKRTGFDKDVIKVDERINISYMVYTGSLLRIFPRPNDENFNWYSAGESSNFDTTDRDFVENVMPLYLSSVNEAYTSGNWEGADQNLSYLFLFQERYGSDIFPDPLKIKLEVFYNEVNIFKRLFPFYSLLGFILLIMLLISTINTKINFRVAIRVFNVLIFLGFLVHTIGLIIRWYVAGHAPWSNGYETMIYIAWATLLSGFIFSKRSNITLAVTAILASLTLMVANLSWMDPEITNLVPVLKSYWLVIHVAVITASYSFLGIGALLGFMVLIIMNFTTKKNQEILKIKIEELTHINEMNLTIGVTMLTIGTFLGAVWANESWGRYWGWDPKETWALVSVLVYSFIIHMRMIPGLNSTFSFNFAALIGFSSILMTYFGVNYYLSGLHSYASGDPVPIPTFVYYSIAIIAITSLMAYINQRKLNKVKLPEE